MNKLEELTEKSDKLSDQLDKQRNEYLDQFNGDIEKLYKAFHTFYELEDVKKLCKKLNKINFEIKKETPVEWEDIPDYGDHMTLKEWKSCVKSGGFIDDDGFGNYASKDKMSNIMVSPSNYHKKMMVDNSDFTHIVWFNK